MLKGFYGLLEIQEFVSAVDEAFSWVLVFLSVTICWLQRSFSFMCFVYVLEPWTWIDHCPRSWSG